LARKRFLSFSQKSKKFLKVSSIVIILFAGCYFLFGLTRASLLNTTEMPVYQYWQQVVLEKLEMIKWLEDSVFDPLKENNLLVLFILAVFIIMVFMIFLFYYREIWNFLSGKGKAFGNYIKKCYK